VTIIAVGYPARCSSPRCKNLGRLALRYTGSDGQVIGNLDFRHAPVRMAFARAAGLKVYDDREAS
jgi:hypothetical protein